MPIKRKYTKIETETGAILEEGTEKVYTTEEINKQDAKNKQNKKLTEFEIFIKEIGSFSFLFYDYLKDLPILPEIKARFIFLTTYIKYNSNCLLVDTDDQFPLSLTRETLKDKLKLKEDAFIKTIKVLKENNLIYENHNCYYIDEKIVTKGRLSKSQKKKSYTRLFSDYVKELYNMANTRQHGQLYYFFAILPLVNFKYNCVCSNREETDLPKIKPMDIKSICEHVGYKPKDWKKFWSNLRYFKINNQNLISTKIYDEYMFISVNPNLYYAGNENCLNEIKILLHEFYNENLQQHMVNK
jgi:hypothetical protein